MKIKLYIITYKGHNRLNKTLETLFTSDFIEHDYKVFIINNHTDIRLDEKFKNKVTILHNVLRPDFSNGHLSRNWNQAIINGFQDLNSPDCDILCHAQDDTFFSKDWVKKIQEVHKKYTFAQFGEGDQLCSYLPEAIKKIGLWDERFCAISLQAADYFARAVIYNKDKSTINDFHHGRLLNNYPEDFNVVERPSREEVAQCTQHFVRLAQNVLIHKWGNPMFPWNDNFFNNLPKRPKGPSYILYPYFEKNIEDLETKGYIIDKNGPVDIDKNVRMLKHRTLKEKIVNKLKYEINKRRNKKS